MKKWLAFANDIKTFDVIKCFEETNICHWRKYYFSKDDIVYLYVQSREKVMYKTIVVSDNVQPDNWKDDDFWINPSESNERNNRVELKLLAFYDGNELTKSCLLQHGLKTTQSLTTPNRNPPSLIEYIESVFEKDNGEYPEEHENPVEHQKDRWKKVYIDRYERDSNEREKCIERYGNHYECIICGFNFEKVYGEIGREFIHVHHINPLSASGEDVSNNLIPVCPNCHAMLHRHLKYAVRDYKELQKLIEKSIMQINRRKNK